MTMKKYFVIFVAVILAVVASGCDSENLQTATSSQQRPRPTQKAKPAQKEKIIADSIPEVKFVYNPVGKRDPFVSLIAERKPVIDKQIPLTPLQQYDLSQFRLIGAIIGKTPQAMVEAPDGKPYVLKKGVLIGKNNGVVVDIDSQKVVVEEKYYDFSGVVRKSLNTIEFPPKQGVN